MMPTPRPSANRASRPGAEAPPQPFTPLAARRRLTRSAGALAILGAGLLFAQPSAHAQGTTWTGGSDSWDAAANWNAGLPTTSGSAIINNGAVVSLGEGVSGEYGTLAIGNIASGSGLVEITGGELSGGYAQIGSHAQGSGTATISDGSWTSSSTIAAGISGKGVFNINGGTVSSVSGYFGASKDSNGTGSVTGGSWTMSSDLYVGNSGTGALTINGGTVSVGSLTDIGSSNSGIGNVTVTSGTLALNFLRAGNSGKGTLTVNGGVVSTSGNSFFGHGTSGDGKLVVSSGTFSADSSLYLGNNGKASVELNGGTIAAASSMYAASTTNSVANISITSGTFTNANSTLYLGYSGTASLTMGGGDMAVRGVTLGYNAGSKGEVTLTGGTWSNSNVLAIGSSGTGNFVMTGGSLSTSGLQVGSNSGSYGTFAVSSGTVTLTNSMSIGTSGTGSVDISGGILFKARTITLAGNASGNGTLKLSGTEGNRTVLEALTFQKANDGSGTASIQFDGGIVKATASATAFLYRFSAGEVVIKDGGLYLNTNGYNISFTSPVGGTGALTKQGTGALTIEAGNSYSGGTVVEGGAIIANADNALGTGGVTVRSGTVSINSGKAFTNAVTLGNGGTFARAVASGGSLANAVNLTSSVGGVSTTATIVEGTNSGAGNANVQGGFTATSSAINDNVRSSDVLHLSGLSVLNAGTGETDVFVLQLHVDDLEAGSLLGWLDDETNLWVNAVDGNLGGSATFINRAYNSETDFVLGYYGIDVENGNVWAVINHNSDFAVVPEPGTWALLLLGGGAFLGWRKRRNARTS